MLASPGLLEFAEEHGLFNSSEGTPFNTVRREEAMGGWMGGCGKQTALPEDMHVLAQLS